MKPPWAYHARVLRLAFLVVLSAVVFIMMTMTALDVAGRYLLSRPLPGTQEATELLLALLVFGAAPLVAADRTHITTDLLESRITGRLRAVRDVSVDLICAAACGVLGWRLWLQATAMASMSGHTPLLGIPIGPVLYFSALMCGACAVMALAHGARAGATAWRA